MQKLGNEIIFSASDLVKYLECEHLTTLDLIDRETPLPRTEDSDEAKLIQAKGHAHEAHLVAALKGRHQTFIDIAGLGGSLQQKVSATAAAMRDGIEVIYQATLLNGQFIWAAADFKDTLLRCEIGGDSWLQDGSSAGNSRLKRSSWSPSAA